MAWLDSGLEWVSIRELFFVPTVGYGDEGGGGGGGGGDMGPVEGEVRWHRPLGRGG